MRLAAIFLVLLVFLLGGCDRNGYDEEWTINYISGGSHIAGEPLPQGYDYAFYLPQYMETIYASRDLDSQLAEYYDIILNETGGFVDIAPMIADGSYYWLLNLLWAEQLGFPHVEGVQSWEYTGNTSGFNIKYIYRFTAKEVSEMNRAAELAADKIMAGITPDMSDYDKLKYFHDYLIINCVSDIDDPLADTIYGALVEKKALCEGYAKAFSYLCNRAGIENMIVYGWTEIYHMWNMVKLNGNWYHVDVTWGNPGFLDYPEAVLYQYFMVTDAEIGATHTIRREFIDPPRANSNIENYFLRENRRRYVPGGGDFLGVAGAALSDAIEKKESSASIRFERDEDYAAAVNMLKQNNRQDGGVWQIIDEISETLNVNFTVNYTDYYADKKVLVFLIDYS